MTIMAEQASCVEPYIVDESLLVPASDKEVIVDAWMLEIMTNSCMMTQL